MTAEKEHEIIKNLKLTAQDMAFLCKFKIRLVIDESGGVKGFWPHESGYESAPYDVKLIYGKPK